MFLTWNFLLFYLIIIIIQATLDKFFLKQFWIQFFYVHDMKFDNYKDHSYYSAANISGIYSGLQIKTEGYKCADFLLSMFSLFVESNWFMNSTMLYNFNILLQSLYNYFVVFTRSYNTLNTSSFFATFMLVCIMYLYHWHPANINIPHFFLILYILKLKSLLATCL